MVKIIQIKRFGILYYGVVIRTSFGHSTLNTFMSEQGARDYIARLDPCLRNNVA